MVEAAGIEPASEGIPQLPLQAYPLHCILLSSSWRGRAPLNQLKS